MQFDEFLSVIDLLKNTTKYEAKITELKEREKAIQDATATYGIVGDVAKAQAKADALVAKAEDVLAKANKQAETIIANAQVVFDKRHAAIQVREVAADQALANYNAIKASFAARDNELRTAEKSVEAARKQLEAQSADLSIKQAELDGRLGKLRQVMG